MSKSDDKARQRRRFAQLVATGMEPLDAARTAGYADRALPRTVAMLLARLDVQMMIAAESDEHAARVAEGTAVPVPHKPTPEWVQAEVQEFLDWSKANADATKGSAWAKALQLAVLTTPGAAAPTKVEHSGRVEHEHTAIDLRRLSDEEFEKLDELRRKAALPPPSGD